MKTRVAEDQFRPTPGPLPGTLPHHVAVIGAAGGAFAGNEIEKNIKKRHVYRVTVRMEDGSYRTLSQAEPPAVGVGTRVRIQDGTLIARS